MVDFPQFSIQEMLESGVHFGHKCRAWNPKMAPFIFGVRNSVHIINLQKTYPLLVRALKAIEKLIRKKPSAKILFVGTKLQASNHIKEGALKCGQFYVDRRWLGGTLTNWNTVSRSIITLENLEKKVAAIESGEEPNYSKKEILTFKRQMDKLERVLGGIRKLKGKPDLMFVIDARVEHIAIKEANKFGVPVMCIVDTNSNPSGIDYVIPGNDDSSKAIKFYCNVVADTILYATAQVFAESGLSIEEMKTAAEKDIAETAVVESEQALSAEDLVSGGDIAADMFGEMSASVEEAVEEGGEPVELNIVQPAEPAIEVQKKPAAKKKKTTEEEEQPDNAVDEDKPAKATKATKKAKKDSSDQ